MLPLQSSQKQQLLSVARVSNDGKIVTRFSLDGIPSLRVDDESRLSAWTSDEGGRDFVALVTRSTLYGWPVDKTSLTVDDVITRDLSVGKVPVIGAKEGAAVRDIQHSNNGVLILSEIDELFAASMHVGLPSSVSTRSYQSVELKRSGELRRSIDSRQSTNVSPGRPEWVLRIHECSSREAVRAIACTDEFCAALTSRGCVLTPHNSNKSELILEKPLLKVACTATTICCLAADSCLMYLLDSKTRTQVMTTHCNGFVTHILGAKSFFFLSVRTAESWKLLALSDRGVKEGELLTDKSITDVFLWTTASVIYRTEDDLWQTWAPTAWRAESASDAFTNVTATYSLKDGGVVAILQLLEPSPPQSARYLPRPEVPFYNLVSRASSKSSAVARFWDRWQRGSRGGPDVSSAELNRYLSRLASFEPPRPSSSSPETSSSSGGRISETVVRSRSRRPLASHKYLTADPLQCKVPVSSVVVEKQLRKSVPLRESLSRDLSNTSSFLETLRTHARTLWSREWVSSPASTSTLVTVDQVATLLERTQARLRVPHALLPHLIQAQWPPSVVEAVAAYELFVYSAKAFWETDVSVTQLSGTPPNSPPSKQTHKLNDETSPAKSPTDLRNMYKIARLHLEAVLGPRGLGKSPADGSAFGLRAVQPLSSGSTPKEEDAVASLPTALHVALVSHFPFQQYWSEVDRVCYHSKMTERHPANESTGSEKASTTTTDLPFGVDLQFHGLPCEARLQEVHFYVPAASHRLFPPPTFRKFHHARFRGTECAVILFKVNKSQEMQYFLKIIDFMLKAPRHTNICGLRGVCLSADEPAWAQIVDWPDRGTLWDLLHESLVPLSLPTVLSIAIGIALGLACLHGSGLVHGCLTSYKILVYGNGPDNYIPRVAFGLGGGRAPSPDGPTNNEVNTVDKLMKDMGLSVALRRRVATYVVKQHELCCNHYTVADILASNLFYDQTWLSYESAAAAAPPSLATQSSPSQDTPVQAPPLLPDVLAPLSQQITQNSVNTSFEQPAGAFPWALPKENLSRECTMTAGAALELQEPTFWPGIYARRHILGAALTTSLAERLPLMMRSHHSSRSRRVELEAEKLGKKNSLREAAMEPAKELPVETTLEKTQAAEQIDSSTDAGVSVKDDIHAVGVILWELLQRTPPFLGVTRRGWLNNSLLDQQLRLPTRLLPKPGKILVEACVGGQIDSMQTVVWTLKAWQTHITEQQHLRRHQSPSSADGTERVSKET